VAFSPAFPQRPRVFLMCAWVCARRWFGYPAVRVRSEDAPKLDPHLPPTDVRKLYELTVASYLKNGAF
jgi:hypothetical protein